MRLDKLEVKGFKSFGDKVTIHFNEGVTAIVGPNGCGKSNVVDAIRWVLGEQSTRMLRSEKMENIIFNGTKNRKPANLAEVSLTFNNTKNILPTEFTTVTITRKLYRSGESEYRLNDIKCRLKDITDLFLDTGVGADSYSIIELKMIDEIIANKDHARRNLFEEASGISKYKVRKKQTLSKLKETEEDLTRVDDLLFEIEKNLRALENQAKKAERYFRIKEEYKIASIDLAYYRIESFSTRLDVLHGQEKTQEEELQAIQTFITKKEAELEIRKKENLLKEKNLATQQKVTNEHLHKIRTYESEKKIKNEQVRHLQDKEAKLQADIGQDKQQHNHVLYNLKRLNEELYEEEAKFESLKGDLNEHKKTVDELRGQQLSAKGKLDTANKQRIDVQNMLYKLEKDFAVLHIQKDALEQETLRQTSDISSKEEELDQFNFAVAVLDGRIDGLQSQYDQLFTAESALSAQIQEIEYRQIDITTDLQKETRLYDAKQHEYNLTKSLVDNLEGFPESIRFLRKNANWKKQYPLFSDILFCKEDYRIAIENFLEPYMNHYVVEDQSEAIHAIRLLSDAARGRAQFFILENSSDVPSPALPPPNDQMVRALDVISVEEKYNRLCAHLLHNVYLLRSDEENHLETALPGNNMVILQRDGKYAKTNLSLSGGSVGLFEGKRIGRAKNLENLSKELKVLQKRIEQLSKEQENDKIRMQGLKSASQKEMLDELKSQLNRLQSELITLKTKQEQYKNFIQSNNTRKQDIEEKLELINAQLAQIQPEIERTKIDLQQQAVQLQYLQDSFNEVSERLTDESTRYNQENILFHQQQNKVSGIQKDIEYRQHQEENLALRLEKNTSELETVKQELKEAQQFFVHNDTDLISLYQQKEDYEKGLKELEEDYYSDRKVISDIEESTAQLRRSKDQATLLANELKEKKTSLQIDLNALKERLSAEFSIDIRDLLDSDMPQIERPEQELQSICDKFRKQLDEYGSINPMAKEAYEEMNERHGFIIKEKTDLLDSKKSLLSTIEEIDQTANDKFMNAFTQVRENFIQVFRSLFNEEDSCDLVLLDPENPLESDIEIIARPKGKRPLSINQLSGGEKTLTSTALLFSLYLLKPAPFCIFDEVDAPLDDTNIDKFNNIIRKFSDQSQFIIVSHNKRTIASTDIIYGVTMVEQGISRVVAVDLRDVA